MSRKAYSICAGSFPQLNEFYYECPEAERFVISRLVAPAVTTSLGLCINMRQSKDLIPTLRSLAPFLRHVYLASLKTIAKSKYGAQSRRCFSCVADKLH
jgi:hypothetical protein